MSFLFNFFPPYWVLIKSFIDNSTVAPQWRHFLPADHTTELGHTIINRYLYGLRSRQRSVVHTVEIELTQS